ncbi:MAG: hypothetical protein R3B09_30210 [Nannocystaceae bacterium]
MGGRAIVTVWALAIAAAIAVGLWTDPWHVRHGLFVLTLVLEIGVVALVFAVRRRLGPDDEARRPWTWIGLGLGARVLAELRLFTLYFHCVPGFIADRPALNDLYIYWLRYFYVAADLLIAGALIALIRSILGLRLGLRLGVAAPIAGALVVALPIAQLLLQRWAYAGVVFVDAGILPFRVISVLTASLVGGLSLALARLAQQMGGGRLALVWRAAAVAGLAKALAFLVGPILHGSGWGGLLDQIFLWTFTGAWWLATLTYRDLVQRR